MFDEVFQTSLPSDALSVLTSNPPGSSTSNRSAGSALGLWPHGGTDMRRDRFRGAGCDIKVLGSLQGVGMMRSLQPGRSAIDQHAAGRANRLRRAALLAQMMAARSPPVKKFLPPLCVVSRQSTNSLSLSDPKVHEAILYLREHLTQGVSVSEVARARRVVASTLQRRFIQALSRRPGGTDPPATDASRNCCDTDFPRRIA